MFFPRLNEIPRYRNTIDAFGGYNHQISCPENQFYDMKNMTSAYFPVLSTRNERGFVKKLTNPQGILDKEELMWIDDGTLYVNGNEVTLDGVTLDKTTDKAMAKMGAFVIIMPDKVWYNADNGECGYMENTQAIASGGEIKFTLAGGNGAAIEWHDSEYYEKNPPKDGDYLMTTVNGKTALKIYASATAIWTNVATTYVQITATGIGKGFNKDDGVKLTLEGKVDSLSNIFVNEEDGKVSTNTIIYDRTDDSVTIPGIISANTTITDKGFEIARKVPEMAFITECNNRLWGCSADGHEIYCCKLGDVKNWNSFKGISTDSWAATIGSDGDFTGAITYLGYPMFFKEDSLIKIAISSTGAHQTKETICRGVQKGSHKSLAILNETLFYKSTTGVCGYNGSLPFSISDALSDIRYYDAVGGTVGDEYYISMHDGYGRYTLFAFDSKNAIWSKHDETQAYSFCKHLDDLYYIDASDNYLKSVKGTLLFDTREKDIEDAFEWLIESGNIGYSSPDNKFLAKINIRITLEHGTDVSFYVMYDSSSKWEYKFSMAGNGTRSYSVPFTPSRCDHFKYKLVGKGKCKIHSITKTIEEGSDTNV